jgi:hypothetical protein
MSGYGSAAQAPGPPSGVNDGMRPLLAAPDGPIYAQGRPYYAEPAYFSQQLGTVWRQAGAFNPAWANPWDYDLGDATPGTVFDLVGTTLPAGGLNPKTGQAQQGAALPQLNVPPGA